ncbi:tail fiber protein [Vibrio panuliri]|uniref:Uncharacterized protein n=1 Tax=Vibrio panuliri TaxID=1381081 RepID=A0ABX3FIW7_9VIBR|nr:tail fiber protein [Vibrio panuliri]KAB1457406.1 hypothetical protein F7O85_06595 [Vibrio panuliri]OLQ91433.1 hypothetical protein BIY20_01085 [Vibrio panuliri]
MSQIIPPPFKIEFPEQIALSDAIDGTRSDVAASQKAVGTLNEIKVTGLSELNQSIELSQSKESPFIELSGKQELIFGTVSAPMEFTSRGEPLMFVALDDKDKEFCRLTFATHYGLDKPQPFTISVPKGTKRIKLKTPINAAYDYLVISFNQRLIF